VNVFPAFLRLPQRGPLPEPVLTLDDAACFYHENKKAADACEACGRFLCALCRVDIGKRILCPGCIQSGKRKGRLHDLTRHRILQDEVALSMAILPLLAWPFTIATAPAAIFWALRHWKSPTSILPRTKLRFVAAILLASIQVAAWVIFFGMVIFRSEYLTS